LTPAWRAIVFITVFIGCVFALATLAIQIAAIVFMLQYLVKFTHEEHPRLTGMKKPAYVISVVMLMLFIGHLVQVAIWAALFMYLGEFSDFLTAFYHSMVNFASLGYGDIVMSEKWRLLGAMEAGNGVLMFGLTAGVVLSVMQQLFVASAPIKEHLKSMGRE
jgi:hypothetical protein